MSLRAIYEGTPASLPVAPFDPANPVYWEAGAVAQLNVDGTVQVASGGAGSNVVGILADRRNTFVNISSQTYLASHPYGTAALPGYGDESLFNQPGYGNDLYGETGPGGTVNAVIPANTMSTTTMFLDETGVNPNVKARLVTVYIIGGQYQTDQFDATVANAAAAGTLAAGAKLYVAADGTGRLSTTNANALPQVGFVVAPPDGNGQLKFQLSLV